MNQITYITYLTISIIIVLYVGDLCVKNGKVYILNFFPKKEKFANALNSSLLIAYYCLNIGLAVWSLNSINNIQNYAQVVLEICTRLSFIILILTGLHFINLMTIYFSYKKFKNK